MSASSFIVNLQWYLVPPSLGQDAPSTPTHENIHPYHLTVSYLESNSSMTGNPTPFPSARPPIIALVIDWIIKVLITHPSSSGCAARRTAPPSAHPSSYLPRYHSTVFHAMANYLLRRSMNSNRNYISPDIQLGLLARPTRLSGTEKKERTIESSL